MAAYTWTGTTSSDWTVSTNWSPNVVGGPTTGDTVTVPSGTPSLTVTANRTILSITFQTGYNNTFTIANGITLTVAGTGATVTLISGMTYNSTTTGVLSTNGSNTAVTINFNGVVIPRLTCALTVGGTQTVTIGSGATPTVQNLNIATATNTAIALAGGTALNITNSLTVALSSAVALSGVPFNITGGGTVNVTCASATNATIAGFTVIAGTTLNMQTDLRIAGSGTVTFQLGSFLNPNGNSLVINLGSNVILNTSAVTWSNILLNGLASLTSDLNLSGNFNAGSGTSIVGSGGTRNINIQGGFSQTSSVTLAMTNTVVNLIGTGVWDSGTAQALINATFIINTSNPTGYTIGSSIRNLLGLSNSTVTLIGSSVVNVFTGHSMTISNSVTLSTNNTGISGSQILWQNLTTSGATLTLTNDTTFNGNVSMAANGAFTINNGKFLIGGNLSANANLSVFTGTSTIELIGSNSCTWGVIGISGTYGNNITINKSGGTVNLLGTINWGAAGRILDKANGNIVVGTSTVSIPNASVTINNMSFNNLTIANGAVVTQNTLNTISSALTLLGNATFAGTAGWTAFSFAHAGAGATCTLKAGVTYTVQGGVFTMIGTALNRARLQSDDAQNVTVDIPASSNLMTLASGTIPAPAAGYVLGSRAFTGTLPSALSNLIPNRPTILSGPVGIVYTLTAPIGTTPVTPALLLQVGKKAFFNIGGSTTTNVAYAETRDIDSNGGITIFAAQSFPDNTATPNLFRTLNWVPLIAPSGSVYYTFVS